MPERANHPSSLSAVVISPRSRAGVTLVELVVTIVVMGILAAVAVPRLGKQSTTAKHHCTWASYGIFERAVEMYRADFGGLPADALPGAQPAGMAEYMRTKAWTTPAPLGGRWDWNNDWGTSGAAGSWAVIGPNMSVCEDPAPVVKWLAFDRAIDNNNLATGNLVRLSSKFLAVKHNR